MGLNVAYGPDNNATIKLIAIHNAVEWYQRSKGNPLV